MLGKFIKKVFGTRNDRLLAGYRKRVAMINAFETTLQALPDDALRAKTEGFRSRLREGETPDTVLPEAFAVVREASRRVLGMRHFDVQLLGGMALHEGRVAEMRTGEGKTLVATLPAYLNALSGQGVHIVTVNDYLATRDAEWMRPLYEFLGLTVGINVAGLPLPMKKAAYAADIIHGTNNEFGFDYLRDNMVFQLDQRVQRPLHYAIIDEVDSILIDEARTPLIISGQAEESSDLYRRINGLIPKLRRQLRESAVHEEELPESERGDYTLDEKARQAHLTEDGHTHVESLLVEMGLLPEGDSLYDVAHITLMHYVNACLRAHTLYQRDVHYIVKNNEVLIVDEHTGRLMQGRRWSEGLHQAVEAKEGVEVQLENQTLATITLQNYFRLYEKISGMTGTADTEAYELQKIYDLEVVVVPTNRPMQRVDLPDLIYLTADAKYRAIVDEIRKRHEAGQPILVGTASIEASEHLASLLQKEGIVHNVLNAKQHEREAKIIADAGRPGAVTIATNMAGRGTDISLGGHWETEHAALGEMTSDAIEKEKAAWQVRHDQVLAAGGLHVLGTERHESRRIDNQLRGRSGRQGDPGSSQFYLSMEDHLLRIFAAERMTSMMKRFGFTENDVIQHPWITRAIENAQRRVEGFNFDIRKNLLEYDDVANDQRKLIYDQRYQLLTSDNIHSTIEELLQETVSECTEEYIPVDTVEEEWDLAGLQVRFETDFGVSLPLSVWREAEDMDDRQLRERIQTVMVSHYAAKCAQADPTIWQNLEKNIMLQVLDHHWKEHLASMDHLRQGIHLRGYAQKNPTQEFKRESFELFKRLLLRIKHETVATLCRLEWAVAPPVPAIEELPSSLAFQHNVPEEFAMAITSDAMPSSDFMHTEPVAMQNGGERIGRNEMCRCGSGKKYKHCHGKLS